MSNDKLKEFSDINRERFVKKIQEYLYNNLRKFSFEDFGPDTGPSYEDTIKDTVKSRLQHWSDQVKCKDDFSVKAYANEETGVMTVDIEASASLYEGRQAWELRQLGIEVDEEVPDCAVIEGGEWQWITVSGTITETKEP